MRSVVACEEVYWLHNEHARVACVRRVEAGNGEEVVRSLPVAVMRRRVCRCGEVLLLRNVMSRFVSSIVRGIGIGNVEEKTSE